MPRPVWFFSVLILTQAVNEYPDAPKYPMVVDNKGEGIKTLTVKLAEDAAHFF